MARQLSSVFTNDCLKAKSDDERIHTRPEKECFIEVEHVVSLRMCVSFEPEETNDTFSHCNTKIVRIGEYFRQVSLLSFSFLFCFFLFYVPVYGVRDHAKHALFGCLCFV